MKNKRGLFNKIFGDKEKDNNQNTISNENSYMLYSLLNTFDTIFSQNTGNHWDINSVRSAVDAYARNFAKLKGRHITSNQCVNKDLEYILQYKPNPLMEAFSFYYKIAANLKLTNNSFIYPVYSIFTGKLIELWPLQSNQIKLLSKNGELYIQFIFKTGKTKVVPYEMLIHIRGQFYDNDILGSKNTALDPAIEQVNTMNQGLSNSAKLINSIRGILSAKISSKDDDLKAKRDQFVKNNLQMSNNGSGVIVTDAKMDYTPINETPHTISNDQLSYSKNEIYNYFGVNEAIIQNKFKEEEWAAFYEGGIEPVAIQMSQIFTDKLFTANERAHGNSILFESNRLQYLSTATKISFAKEIAPMGCLMKDEIREIFQLGPMPNGEGQKFIQSLNWINGDKADEYQLGKSDEGGDDNEGNKDKPDSESESGTEYKPEPENDDTTE